MNKYKVSWTIEEWYETAIEANSPSEALDKFHNNDYDSTPEPRGSELQDSVEIEEM